MQDATQAFIAFPASDPEMLAQALYEALGAPVDRAWGGLRSSNLPGQPGKRVSTFSSTVNESGSRVSLFVSGWDIEASVMRVLRPKEMDLGAWASISSEFRDPKTVQTMTSLAKRLGGFLQFTKHRTQRDGGPVTGPWISPDAIHVMPGLDTAKHQLMMTLGAESAPVVEKILRSDEAMETVIGVLEVERVSQAAVRGMRC